MSFKDFLIFITQTTFYLSNVWNVHKKTLLYIQVCIYVFVYVVIIEQWYLKQKQQNEAS